MEKRMTYRNMNLNADVVMSCYKNFATLKNVSRSSNLVTAPSSTPPRYRVINPLRHVRVINPLRRCYRAGRHPVGSLVPFIGRTSNRLRFEVVDVRCATCLVR